MDELKAFVDALSIIPEQNDLSDSPFISMQHWYPRVWDEWARHKDGAEPADIYGQQKESVDLSDTKDLRVRLKQLLPAFTADSSSFGEPRCANELSFRFYDTVEPLAEVLPRYGGAELRRAISGITVHQDEWRIGRNGLVRLVRNDSPGTRPIPLAEEVVFAWLKDQGWNAQIAPPGLLAKNIYKRLDGSVQLLRNERVLGLLEHMNGGLVGRDGRSQERKRGVVGAERNMPVGEVKKRLRDPSYGDRVYDFMVSKEIFKLGSVIQCPQCRRKSWFGLEFIRDEIRCPRCLAIFSALGSLDQSKWSLRTAGPFSVPNYAEGAYAVLLTLEFFGGFKVLPLRTTPALSFTAEAQDRKNLEADLALFWKETILGESREGLIFAECKTYGEFEERDFDRIRYIAQNFPDAVLVFSTLRKHLTRREVTKIRGIAQAGRRYWKAERPINPLLVLTGTELLHPNGPPLCWDEAIRERIGHLRGLLEICEATQKLYLNLTSWHDEWQDRGDRRRQRRLTKNRSESV